MQGMMADKTKKQSLLSKSSISLCLSSSDESSSEELEFLRRFFFLLFLLFLSCLNSLSCVLFRCTAFLLVIIKTNKKYWWNTITRHDLLLGCIQDIQHRSFYFRDQGHVATILREVWLIFGVSN